MELALIKYLTFLIGTTFVLWITLLWLKANKKKRKQNEKSEERLEIQKELHKQMLIEKQRKENNLSK